MIKLLFTLLNRMYKLRTTLDAQQTASAERGAAREPATFSSFQRAGHRSRDCDLYYCNEHHTTLLPVRTRDRSSTSSDMNSEMRGKSKFVGSRGHGGGQGRRRG